MFQVREVGFRGERPVVFLPEGRQNRGKKQRNNSAKHSENMLHLRPRRVSGYPEWVTERAHNAEVIRRTAFAGLLVAWFFFFNRDSVNAPFGADEMMNIAAHWRP